MLTILYIISLLLLIYVTCNSRYNKYRVYVKSFTSLLFVLLYLNNDHNLIMLSAFIFCFLGDLFLGININGIKKYMMVGLACFLIGHLFYLTSFFGFTKFVLDDLLIPLIGFILINYLIKKLDMHLGSKKIPILIYTLIVFLMGAKAIDVLVIQNNLFGTFIGFGGILFVVSDFILLFLYFKYKGNLKLQLANTIIYYLAQYLLAQAFWFK